LKLNEYLAKNILKNEGIPIPRGFISRRPEQVLKKYKLIGFPLVLKAQIPIASRKKRGGILFVKNLDELKRHVFEIFSKNISGYNIEEVLVEEMINIQREIYLSFTIDRGERKYVFMASSMGGIDIENIAKEKPSIIIKIHIDPLIGLLEYHVRKVLKKLNISDIHRENVRNIILKMYNIFIKYDCELIEINPLAISSDGRIYAVDAKIMLDESALYRHRDLIKMVNYTSRKYSYVELDGDIGIMSNGAGLTMATMDIVKYFGGKPANFLDIAISSDGRIYAVDAKIMLDESALYRHRDLIKMVNYISRKYSYVELDGDIGIMSNGAGLTMATMDIVKYFGGRPANFLDIGGGASADAIKNALKILLNKSNVKVILINIFGGITRCDEVARGIVKAIDESSMEKPIVIRLMGTNEEEGIKILLNRKNIIIVDNMEEAAKRAIKISREE